jgi:hypothetical protein
MIVSPGVDSAAMIPLPTPNDNIAAAAANS